MMSIISLIVKFIYLIICGIIYMRTNMITKREKYIQGLIYHLRYHHELRHVPVLQHRPQDTLQMLWL